MEQELISKKELLEITGISYGQLYRWKRMRLIPEDWFIRKSAVTGQETFFPREKMLQRIDKIKNMKENLSLDDVAGVLSPHLADTLLLRQEVTGGGVVPPEVFELLLPDMAPGERVTFETVLFLFVVGKQLATGEINRDEGKLLFTVLRENYARFQGRECELVMARKMGVSFGLLAGRDVGLEKEARVVVRQNMPAAIEELKTKIN